MRFEFSGETRPGIRVLPHIEDGRLLRLTGRNGIGKSLALNLLAICANPSADNPYMATPDAWISLRDSLTDGYTVKAFEPGGEELVRWTLKPSEWPRSPSAFDYSMLGSIEIRGEPTPIDRYQRDPLIEVIRLSGRESIIDVLANRVARDSAVFRSHADRLQEGIAGAADQISEMLNLLEHSDPRRIAELERREKSLSQEAAELEREIAKLDDMLSRFEHAESLEKKIAEIDHELPKLQERRGQLDGQRERLREEAANLSEEIAAGIEQRAGTKERRRQLKKEEGRLEGRRKRHARSLEKLKERLSDRRVGATTHEDALRSVERLQHDLEAVSELLTEVRNSGPLIEVVRGARDALDIPAVPDDETLFEDVEGRVSLGRARSGLRRRQRDLQSKEPGAHLLELEERHTELLDELEAHEWLVAAFEDVARKKELVETSEAALREMNQATGDDQLSLATASREQVHMQLMETEAAIQHIDVQIERLMDGRSMQEWHAEKEAIARSDRSEAGAADLQARRADLQRQHVKQENALEVAQEELADARVAAEAALYRLRELDIRIEGPRELDRSTRRFKAAGEYLDSHRLRAVAASRAWRTLLDSLRSGSDAGKDDSTTGSEVQDYRRALADHYSQVLVKEFGTPEMRKALFDGATPERIDLADRSVRWRREDGQLAQRPLQAFSSGQMVFGYTKARLEQLGALAPNTHRVIALDEFGAFLDQTHRQLLVRQLAQRLREHSNEQVVLVLPGDPRDGFAFEEMDIHAPS